MQPVGSIRPPVDRRLFELLKANTPAVEPQDTVESGAFRVRDSKPGVALLRQHLRPGTLYVVDHFDLPPSLSTPGLFAVVEHQASSESHGVTVGAAARESGFKGPLISIDGSGDLNIDDPGWAWRVPWRKSEDPAELAAALKGYFIWEACAGLKDRTAMLHELCQAGVTNSAVNFSSGTSLAGAVEFFLDAVLGKDDLSEEEKANLKAERKKFEVVLGLAGEKLGHADPAVADSEWARLIQGLLDLAVEAHQSPAFQQVKANYDRACEMFTANNNSLIVSAGNEQEVPDYLEAMCGGTSLKFPADFLVNDLSNSHTVTVGALEGNKVAEYSCRFPSVHFYADGRRGEETGTSVSAPRLSAVMAKMHKRQPEWNSLQVQSYVSEHLCVTMDGVRALDPRAANRFLRS